MTFSPQGPTGRHLKTKQLVAVEHDELFRWVVDHEQLVFNDLFALDLDAFDALEVHAKEAWIAHVNELVRLDPIAVDFEIAVRVNRRLVEATEGFELPHARVADVKIVSCSYQEPFCKLGSASCSKRRPRNLRKSGFVDLAAELDVPTKLAVQLRRPLPKFNGYNETAYEALLEEWEDDPPKLAPRATRIRACVHIEARPLGLVRLLHDLRRLQYFASEWKIGVVTNDCSEDNRRILLHEGFPVYSRKDRANSHVQGVRIATLREHPETRT